MENIDVLDKYGNKTGIIKTKKEVYENGDYHRTVHIWIINNDKELLVQKRHPKKETFPNLWAISVAGHVKSGESSIDAVKRELKEEIGQKTDEENIEFLFTLRREQPYKNHLLHVIDDVYLVNLNIDVEKTKLQFSELTDIKYVYYEYLEQIFKNSDPEYVPYTLEHEKLFEFLHKKFAAKK